MRLLESKQYIDDLKQMIDILDISEIKNKSIAVVGGLGLIGSAFVDLLYVSDYPSSIIVMGRNEKEYNNRYSGYEKIQFVHYDALEQLSVDLKPDYIVYGAGIASPELYTQKPVETLLSNINGITEWLKYLSSYKRSRLLYISSSEVYGTKDTNEPFEEGKYGIINIDSIRSSYSIAKQASEMLCKAYCKEYDLDVVLARPGHVYGPSAAKHDKRISSDFAYKAAAREKLVMKSSGMQKRSYTYSVEAAAQLLVVLLNGIKGEAYNIGHDGIISIREMAEVFAKVGGVELSCVEPTEEERLAFNPMSNSSLVNSKVKRLGYRDCFTIEEGLRHTVQILRELNESDQSSS